MREKKKETPENAIKREKEKRNQYSIFLLYLVSFSLRGPSPQGPAGESGMQRDGEREKGKRQKSLTSSRIEST